MTDNGNLLAIAGLLAAALLVTLAGAGEGAQPAETGADAPEERLGTVVVPVPWTEHRAPHGSHCHHS